MSFRINLQSQYTTQHKITQHNNYLWVEAHVDHVSADGRGHHCDGLRVVRTYFDELLQRESAVHALGDGHHRGRQTHEEVETAVSGGVFEELLAEVVAVRVDH